MDREEPKFGSADMSGVEFRQRSYRGPDQSASRPASDGLAWKIGVAVGVAVFGALILFSFYERYQDRKDAEQALAIFNAEMKKLEAESMRQLRSASMPARPAPVIRQIKPVPPGFRCSNGTLLKREGNGWSQITSRSRQVYCPIGGTVDDCYWVTPSSVGCR